MVEVDVFWSYALGASFACAAARQIRKKDEDGNYDILEDRYFTKSLLYIAGLFAPSGILLLWGHCSWETMHVWSSHETLSKWIVVLFAITNVTQGVLGYWVASKLIRSGKIYEANLTWIAGYFMMFFILVHGWDGTGYRRFFTGTASEWAAGSDQFGLWLALDWIFTAKVAYTLYVLGVFLLPLLFYMIATWTKDGYGLDENINQEKAIQMTKFNVFKSTITIVFVYILGSVIVSSILIHLLTWIPGIILSAAGIYFMAKKGGLLHNKYKQIMIMDE